MRNSTNSKGYFWAVVYTRSRAEKQLQQLVSQQNVECYLPLQKRLRQWSDRKKWVEEPLFRSYLFVRISEKEYFKVLNTPGAVKYVSFGGEIATVREEEVSLIKGLLAAGVEIEVLEHFLPVGTQVQFKAGGLVGLRGELLTYKNKQQVVVRLDSIQHALMLTVSAAWLEPVAVLP